MNEIKRDEAGSPLKGVRYTEYRLAELFEPGADGFQVLQALAYQSVTKYGAAKLIQKLLKGQRVSIPVVDVTKPLKPYPPDHVPESISKHDSDD